MENLEQGKKVTIKTLSLFIEKTLQKIEMPMIISNDLASKIISFRTINNRIDIKHEEGYYVLFPESISSTEVIYYTEPNSITVGSISEAIRIMDKQDFMGIRFELSNGDKVIILDERDYQIP